MRQQQALSTKIANCLVAFFPIAIFVAGSGYNLAAIFLLLAALTYFGYQKKNHQLPSLEKDDKLLMLSFGLYFLVYLFSFVVQGGRGSDLDQVSRFVLVIPIFYYIVNQKLSLRTFSLGLAIACILALIQALITVYYFGQDRAFSPIDHSFIYKKFMPIQNGNIALSLAVISLFLLPVYAKLKDHVISILLAIGSVSGVLASLLSGARGGWICIPPILLYFVFCHRHNLTLKRFSVSFLAFSVISGALYFSAKDDIDSRVLSAKNDVAGYISSDERDSSLGVRFDLWKSAIYTFKQYPLFGAGAEKRLDLRLEAGEIGLINKETSKWESHSHNQFLEALSVRGILGLGILLFLFYAPVRIFNKLINQKPEYKDLGHAGIAFIVSFMIFSLSQAMFSHNSGTTYFAIMSAILVALSLQYSKDKLPTN